MFVTHGGRSELTTTLLSETQVRDLVERTLESPGRHIDLSSPFVETKVAARR